MGKADIFQFWSKIKRGERIHPADQCVFKRMDGEKHGFSMKCLPSAFTGCLRTAPIVLLYLSPGLSDGDINEASSTRGQDHYCKRWTGMEPLPDPDILGYNWFKSRTKPFGEYEKIKDKIAVLNIGAYHSKNVRRFASILTLPSSRVSLDWAQNVLFPQAEQGKKVVVCMRSAEYWGLEKGKKYNGHLYAPQVTRNGYLMNDNQKKKIVKVVCNKLQEI